MKTVFTLQEAADELGVHYMTAYRYVRLGQLDASKVGGIWQVDRAAIDAFRNGTSSGPVVAGASAPWAERLESRLVDGDAQGSWGVVEAAMTSGADVRTIYVDVISPAMVAIGKRWAAGEFDIAVEHQATGIVMRIIGRLGPRFARRGRSRGGLVVGSPEGEHHALAAAMLGDLMRLHGWDVTDLGQNTPPDSFLDAALRTPNLVAVAVSITNPDCLPAAARCCAMVRARLPEVLLVVGGQAVHGDPHAAELGADVCATSDEQFHQLLLART